MAILRIRQRDGSWAEVPSLVGSKGEPGAPGPQGIQGPKGDPFSVAKVYESVAAMNAGYSTDGVAIGSFVVVETGNINDADNAKLYVKGNTAYEYLTDLSGAQGMKGEPGVSVTSVEGIGYTAGEGLDGGFNTYRMNFSDGNYFEFNVHDGGTGSPGVSVTSVEGIGYTSGVGMSGGFHTYRMNFSDGTYFEFDVQDGDTGYSGVHVGSSTPPTGANVWISDTEEYNGAEEWEFQMADGSVVKKVMLVPAEGEALRAFRVRKEDGSWQDVPMLMSEVGSVGGSVDTSNILRPVDGYLIGGPNLVGDVRTLTVNGEVDENNLIKFRGATVEPGSLVGRWVLIAGRRCYIGTNTVDTLVLFTDETKSETLDLICPSGTTIYPADINVEAINGIDIRSIGNNSSSGSALPAVTTTDNGKFLRVVDGAWAIVALQDVSVEGM